MGLWPTTVTKSCTQELLADVRPKVLQDIGKLVSRVPPKKPTERVKVPRHGLRDRRRMTESAAPDGRSRGNASPQHWG